MASTASPCEDKKTPGDAPLEEAVLDVLLRRDGVAAGDGREACGRRGAFSARRAARERAAARAQRSGHPWRRRAGESAGADAIWNWRPSQLPGGSRAAGTHQMQRQSCQRRLPTGFASWMSYAEGKQWHFADLLVSDPRVLRSCRSVKLRPQSPREQCPAATPTALVGTGSYRAGHDAFGDNLPSGSALCVLGRRVQLMRTPIEHMNCLRRHACKKSGSKHVFGW